MTSDQTSEPMSFDHKNIHEALAAAYRDCGYVQKQHKPGLGYSYAGEAALIAAIRPVMVEHQIYAHIAQIRDVERVSIPRERGVMNFCRLTAVVRFTHGPSGTSVDVEAVGEGADVGDKATNKASTGAYKYALRQTFMIETGDDPDGTPSTEYEQRQAPPVQPRKTVARTDQGPPFGHEDEPALPKARTPMPEFPAPRGDAATEWTLLTNAIVEKRVNRQQLAHVFGGTFNLPAFEKWLDGHAGRSAETAIISATRETVGATS